MGGAFLMTILLMPAKWLMFRLACQSLFSTDCFGFTVFLCGGCTGEFNGFAEVLLDASLNFIQRYMEKFTAQVDEVYTARGESIVQGVFKCDSIFGKNEGMNVKTKRNGSITEFIYSVLRIETAGHANLINVFAKRADIRDDVDIACAGLLLALGDSVKVALQLLSIFIQFSNARLYRCGFFRRCRFQSRREGRKLIGNVLLVFNDFCPAFLQFPFEFRFFPFIFADLTDPFFFSLFELLIVIGNGQLVELQGNVLIGNRDIHARTD